MTSESLSKFDIIAIVVSGGLLFLYNVFFFTSVSFRRHSPIQLALNLMNTEHWIEKHKEKDDPQSVTLAIQTMRNTILVAVFVGGYSLNFAYSIVGDYDADNQSMRKNVRAIILSVLLFCSFLCWACVIRHASHLGYMIGTLGYTSKVITDDHPSDKVEGCEADITTSVGDGQTTHFEVNARKERLVAKFRHDQMFLKKRATLMFKQLLVYFSLGFRFLFVAIPFAFYGVGPIALLIATFVIILFSVHHDFNFPAPPPQFD